MVNYYNTLYVSSHYLQYKVVIRDCKKKKKKFKFNSIINIINISVYSWYENK